jgi:hypothetical protein
VKEDDDNGATAAATSTGRWDVSDDVREGRHRRTDALTSIDAGIEIV